MRLGTANVLHKLTPEDEAIIGRQPFLAWQTYLHAATRDVEVMRENGRENRDRDLRLADLIYTGRQDNDGDK